MKSQLKNLVRGELIGLKIEVVDSRNPSLRGKKGTIIDETKNMLVIREDNQAITTRLVKEQVILKIGNQTVPGVMLCERPEERIKVSSKKLNRTKRLVEKNATKNKNKKSGS
ncbi:MAG: ribonuclease P protein subunit [Nanoarchaeota archaeon]|nr:ribonuclease P protein subunit [Nanoarchaeota archaeon]